jgi:hypothetical protein
VRVEGGDGGSGSGSGDTFVTAQAKEQRAAWHRVLGIGGSLVCFSSVGLVGLVGLGWAGNLHGLLAPLCACPGPVMSVRADFKDGRHPLLPTF